MKNVGARIEHIPAKYRKGVISRLDAVAEALKKARIARDLTQEDLAEMVDVEVSTIKSIEQKKRIPSLGLLFHLCEVMNISVKIEK